MGAAALELGWHHKWHFQGAVGWHGLTGWAGQPMGEKGKLWDTVVKVKATKKLRRSQSGFSSINQSSRIPSGKGAMDLLLASHHKRCLAALQHQKLGKPIQTLQNHVLWKEGTSPEGGEQGLTVCSLTAVVALLKNQKCYKSTFCMQSRGLFA